MQRGNIPENSSKMVKHILHLTQEEKVQFIESFDHVFSDCDGVVWMGVGEIEGASDGFNRLQGAGKSLKFVSNNALRTDEDYIKKLNGIGIKNVKPQDLIHPDKTIITFLKSNPKYKNIFAITGSTIKDALRDNGFNVIEMPEQREAFTLQTFAESIVPTDPVDAVIIDIDLDLTLAKYCRGLQYVKIYPECDVIVGATDNLVPLRKDAFIPGPEPIIRYMEQFSGKKPIVLGKPGPGLGDHIFKIFDIKIPKRNLFIGDNLTADIGFAKSLGFQTLFVLSGAHTFEDMMNAPDEHKPNYYATGVADFTKFFEGFHI